MAAKWFDGADAIDHWEERIVSIEIRFRELMWSQPVQEGSAGQHIAEPDDLERIEGKNSANRRRVDASVKRQKSPSSAAPS